MKIGNRVYCIKDNNYMPTIIKGNTYIIESKYDEIKYNAGPKPITVFHEDIFYIICENKFQCLFSLVERPNYFYFYDYFINLKENRKLKLQKLYESNLRKI